MVQIATASPADEPDDRPDYHALIGPRPDAAADPSPTAPPSRDTPIGQAQTARERAIAEDQTKRRIANQLRRLNLPAHFRRTTFDTLDPSLDPEAYEVCQSYADTGSHLGCPGLLLMGPPGSGKTALAAAILRRTVERTLGRYSVAFWNVPRGLASLRDSFGRGSSGTTAYTLPASAYSNMPIVNDALGDAPRTAASDPAGAGYQSFTASVPDAGPQRLQDLLYHRLLVLDDLGKQRLTEWVAEQFYVLINGLWSSHKQVVITTNLTPAGLKSHLEPALVSRLLGLCHMVPLDGQDLRLYRP